MPRPLRFYQKEGLRYCLDVKHPGLLWEMRLGKCLVVIRTEKVRGSTSILIVAPYSAILSWEEELETEKQSYITLDMETKDRLDTLKKYKSKVKYIIVSKEFHRYTPEIENFTWDALVIDEAHWMSNPNKMAKFYAEKFRDVGKRYILTGTAALESELQYYYLLRFLDHKNWSFKNYWGFKNKLFFKIGYELKVKPGAYNYITKAVSKCCSVLRRADVDLQGTIIEEIRPVELTKKVRGIYNKLEKEFALIVNEETVNSTIWATTKYIWLLRLCGGWLDKEFISYSKVKQLKELLDNEFRQEQTITFCHFKKECKFVKRELGKKYNAEVIHGDISKPKRKEIIKAFRKGDIQHLICQPSSVKEGSNLSNADIEIFYSLPNGATTYYQVKDRFISVGTTGSKLIIYLIVKGSIEEVKLISLKERLNNSDRLLLMVRYLQKKWR